MSRFTVTVTGDKKLSADFRRIAEEARPRLRRALQFLGLKLVGHIQRTKLAGQRLHQRSGRLVSSIHEETVEEGGSIVTHVGTNVAYAAIHEYGFQGPAQVKAHLREIKQAFGKPIAPVTVHVRAHPMKMNIGEKRYMRDSLDEFRPEALRVLDKLATDIAKDATK